MGYPIQLREAVLKKVLQRNKPQHEIAKEFGVSRSTIGKWLREYKQNGSINLSSKEKRPRIGLLVAYRVNFFSVIKYMRHDVLCLQ
jgi:transposase